VRVIGRPQPPRQPASCRHALGDASIPACEAVISDFAAIVAAGMAVGALGQARWRSIEHETTVTRSRALVETGWSVAFGPLGGALCVPKSRITAREAGSRAAWRVARPRRPAGSVGERDARPDAQ